MPRKHQYDMSRSQESEAERFTRFVRAVVNVPGSKVKQQIEAEKKARTKKRANSSSSFARASRAKD